MTPDTFMSTLYDIAKFDKQVQEATDTALCLRLAKIDNKTAMNASMCLHAGQKDRALAAECGAIAEYLDSEDALVMLEAMIRINPKQ